jgi:nickel superoxide dismutase
MMRFATIFTVLTLAVVSSAFGHCQIPCGIYDDEARLDMLGENISTIEKAIKQVDELTRAESPDYNQIVRWINVKDEHADDISDVVSWYFLQQRIKPVDEGEGPPYEDYMHKLRLLHHMLVYSMKAKQSMDLANVEKLRMLLGDFKKAYLGEPESHEGHSH